jgi:hypothetical protein
VSLIQPPDWDLRGHLSSPSRAALHTGPPNAHGGLAERLAHEHERERRRPLVN